MKKIKFSVLMSVYEKEKASNLKEAIESILNQTLLPDEFLIIEDGKLTNELNRVLNKFEKENNIIRRVKLEENLGLGKALSIGVTECKFDYIARMDSDDISLPDRFEEQIKIIENNPEIDVLGGWIEEFDSETKEKLQKRKVPLTNVEIKKYIKKRNPMNHVTTIYKKKCVQNVGSYEDCPYFEDYYLWAKMIKNNYKLCNTDKILVQVRAGSKMSKRRGNFQYAKCIKQFEKKLYKLRIINYWEFLFLTFCRCNVALCPNFIRKIIYKRLLRSN